MSNKINLNELNKYRGDVCLYSLKLEDNLGSLVKNTFKELFINNSFSYNNSLAFKTTCPLILIDGDDFNPSKIAGLVKSYEVPVVIFIGNEQKKAKLLEVLLVEPTIVDKNTCKEIACSDEVARNIEEKKKKDAEREALREKNPTVVSTASEEEIKKVEPVVEDFFFSSGMLSVPKEEEPKEKTIDDILESKNIDKDIKKDFFDKKIPVINEEVKGNDKEEVKEVPKNQIFGNVDIPETNTKPEQKNNSLPKSFDFLETEELEKTFDFSKTKRAAQEKKEELAHIDDENNFYYQDKKLSRIGCYTNDLSVSEVMKEVFNNFETIDVLNNKRKYDIVILDITFALVDRVLNFLEFQNCPAMIIIKSMDSKKEEFLQKNFLDIYLLEKPLAISPKLIKEEFKKYLNHFDYNKANSRRTLHNPNYVKDDFDERNIRRKEEFSSSKTVLDKNPKMYKKPSVDAVKKEIRSTNRRQDKVESLESIYKRLGLDDIVAFNSNINKSIFICNDNKVIKYTPVGYLIEFRIKRLEGQGLARNQINSVLKTLEDADIKYQRKILQEIEDKKYS